MDDDQTWARTKFPSLARMADRAQSHYPSQITVVSRRDIEAHQAIGLLDEMHADLTHLAASFGRPA